MGVSPREVHGPKSPILDWPGAGGRFKASAYFSENSIQRVKGGHRLFPAGSLARRQPEGEGAAGGPENIRVGRLQEFKIPAARGGGSTGPDGIPGMEGRGRRSSYHA